MQDKRITAIIDGTEYECTEEISVLNFLRRLGTYIPSACCVEGKTDGGRCLVCAVEINGEIKPSCNTLLQNGMEIKTDTLDVVRARAWATRFLLAHHPPLCHSCHKLGTCVIPIAQKESGRSFNHKFKDTPYETKAEKINGITFYESKCIYCGLCDNKKNINEETARLCPTGALEII